jgi:hypothetical protein
MTKPDSMFAALLASIQKTADFNRDDMTAPAAVLWPDEKREWEKLVPRLQATLPQFLTFGPFDAAHRSGPALWLRCVLAGKVAAVTLPPGTVPIIYLPGVSRATLRATEDCPQELKPLAELQYSGVIWSQVNAKDWTIAAFLQAEKGGLNLTVARDQATGTSLRRALEKLADVPLAELEARSAAGELNATYFDSLMSEDLVDDLLLWMSKPKDTRGRWEPGRWETLCGRCLADYGFDPARDGELVGAEKLGMQPKGAWKTAWKRYALTPARYPGLEALLRKAKPASKGSLFVHPEEYWPQDNEAEEAELRTQLRELPSEPVASARQALIALEQKHGCRREWVWARLNQSPLASAILHLAALATVTTTPLAGGTLADMVKAYTEGGWKADAAVLDALAGPHERDQDETADEEMEGGEPARGDVAQDAQADHDGGVGHPAAQGDGDDGRLACLPAAQDDDGDARQADDQGDGPAAVGRFAEEEDAGQVHPHGGGVLQQDGVGGRPQRHGRDEQGVHDRERPPREEHDRPEGEVAPPQEGQEHGPGEDDAEEGDLQRFDGGDVEVEGRLLAQDFGEDAACAPEEGGEDDAQPGGARGERDGGGHQVPLS